MIEKAFSYIWIYIVYCFALYGLIVAGIGVYYVVTQIWEDINK